jgi:hypothetical protein
MLIKSMHPTKKGKVILHTADEAASHAVKYGIKTLNTKDKVYWALTDKIDVHNVTSAPGDAGYKAVAKGTAMVGYTVVSTDAFYAPESHKFLVEYESSKDSLGLPDIKVTKFVLDPVNVDPARLRKAF